ncbi:thioredoxin-domain-containing protein [Atractiella rhizophila]|nr:thioredoxin-domain-containing protein [Atractiella rhizophila]
MYTSTLLSLALLSAQVYAGLEDAVHSKKLDSKNFQQSILQPEQGTLIAFFAPWCGHCKNLAGTWDKVAENFENDERCSVAHFDADAADNKEIAHKYGVQGYPTIKYFPRGGSPIDYSSARSEQAFLDFLNDKCGTFKGPGGVIKADAGVISLFEGLVSQFFNTASDLRTEFLDTVPSLMSEAASNASSATKDAYIKVMKKIVDNEAYLEKEAKRLEKLVEKKGKLAGKKLEQVMIRKNLLDAFVRIRDAAIEEAKEAKETVEETVEKVQEKVKEEL